MRGSMEIDIRTSTIMDDLSFKETSRLEDRIIRVPASYRIETGFGIGRFMQLRNRSGGIETLQVKEAFKEDVSYNEECAYVTTKTYNKLFKTELSSGDIKVVDDIMLGCDPEAFLVDRYTGTSVGAYRFLKKHGQVGNDGMLLEFRPLPAATGDQVTKNLSELIMRARRILDSNPEGSKVDIVGGSSFNGLTAGFHLHYGLPKGLLGFKRDVKIVARLMTSAFDYYVGVPSIIPEGNVDIQRRVSKFSAYGKPGEHRLDTRTLEFRMPGGINLTHPILTRGLLDLGAVVAEDVASRINSCTDCFINLKEMSTELDIKQLYPNLLTREQFYPVICNPDIGLAKKHFEIVKSDVRKMIGYKKRQKSVEEYFDCLDRGVCFGRNIVANWRGFDCETQGEVLYVRR